MMTDEKLNLLEIKQGMLKYYTYGKLKDFTLK